MSRSTESQVHPARGIIGVLPYLLDIIVPLVSYYGLTAAGLSSFWALVAGGAVTTVISLVNTIRRGRLDSLGVLVIAEIILSIVLTLTTRDPRLTLARGSLYIALAGAWILASAFTRRPLTVNAAKPMATRKGAGNGVAFEWLAANSPQFLRIHRVLSAIWGGMFLAYAAARVIIIYSVGLSEAVWLTELPGVVAIAIGLIASARAGKRFETLVSERMERSQPAGPEHP